MLGQLLLLELPDTMDSAVTELLGLWLEELQEVSVGALEAPELGETAEEALAEVVRLPPPPATPPPGLPVTLPVALPLLLKLRSELPLTASGLLLPLPLPLTEAPRLGDTEELLLTRSTLALSRALTEGEGEALALRDTETLPLLLLLLQSPRPPPAPPQPEEALPLEDTLALALELA
jgi:hypothetical protein